MSLHLERQIDVLKKRILGLGAQVEEAVGGAILAVESRDPDSARAIIDGDDRIDLTEVDIEEECLKTLALHQPVALDLRYVVAVLKINNELERIGDLAVNVADQAIALTKLPPLATVPFDLPGMTRIVGQMLQQSLDALVNADPATAEGVRRRDRDVDAIHRDMYRQVEAAITAEPGAVATYIHMLSVSRNLERIADHAVNIAEDVIYLTQGEIPRHRGPVPAGEEQRGGGGE